MYGCMLQLQRLRKMSGMDKRARACLSRLPHAYQTKRCHMPELRQTSAFARRRLYSEKSDWDIAHAGCRVAGRLRTSNPRDFTNPND